MITDAEASLSVQDLFMRLTLDSICKVGFGVEIGTLHPSLPAVPFATNFDNANEAVTYRFFDPLWQLKKLLNIGSEAVLSSSVKVVDDFTYRVVQTRRAELHVATSQGKQQVGI
jgi:cytochrome P450